MYMTEKWIFIFNLVATVRYRCCWRNNRVDLVRSSYIFMSEHDSVSAQSTEALQLIIEYEINPLAVGDKMYTKCSDCYICPSWLVWIIIVRPKKSVAYILCCLGLMNLVVHSLVPTVRNSLLVRTPDSWSKGCEFESRQERRENFLRRSELCVFTLIRCPFHPRLTAVARKRPRLFLRKCRWQVTPKHVYTLDQTKSEWADYAAVQA